jgi:adenylosuccinate lyase
MVALSPLDSRYANKLTDVRKIFNEESYYKRMFDCEILWYKYVYETFEDKTLSLKNELKFSLEELKDIEKETNHDVKAVEYLVKRKLGRFSRKQYVHFGLTSEDLVSYALNSEFYEFNSYFYSCLEELEMSILKLIQQNEKLNFIGRTHGQKATLTSVYHQFGTFKERLLEVKVAVGDAKRYSERAGRIQ